MARRKTFTNKFQTGQTVFYNNPSTTVHGRQGKILSVNRKTNAHPYEVLLDGDAFAYFHPEEELSASLVTTEHVAPERPAAVHQEFGIGRIGDADPAMEALAELEAIEITKRQNAGKPKRAVKMCDCGHYSAWPMSTSSGSSCPDCYDRMSE